MAKRFAFGPFLLDTARGTLTRDGAALAVGQRGLRILQALLDAAGEAVSKEALLQSAWPGLVVEDSNLSVQVTALRRLLGSSTDAGPEWIATVPRLGYRLSGDVAVEDTQLAPLGQAHADHGGRPSIAVLPFSHLGDDPAREYLADGLTEALITALTRFRWFSVTGRNASQVYKLRQVDGHRTAAHELGVRYVVEGSVRRSATRLRISAQLVDARSGGCLWAEHYDRAEHDIFEIQDDISHQVAGAIEPQLLDNVGSAAAHRAGRSMNGWELVAKGSWLFHHVTAPSHRRARDLFRQACHIDAELSEARSWLARVDAGLVAYGWSEDVAADLREGHAAALEAVQLDAKNPYAHYALAIVSNYRDDFAQALRSAEKAIELNPCFALGSLVRGMAALFSGDAPQAIQALEFGLRLNRHDPQNLVWYNLLALAHLFDGKPEEARRSALAALAVRPTWRAAMRSAAAASAAAGLWPQAAEWSRCASVAPAASDALQPLWRCNPRWADDMRRLEDAARAGSHQGRFTAG